MTRRPWLKPCPVCGRAECAWHERGGYCDGAPREGWPLPDVRSVVEMDALAEDLLPIPWWERLWAWLTSPWRTR